MAFSDDHRDLNLEATELRLGLPGTNEDNQKSMIMDKNKQFMKINNKRSALVLDINGEEDEDQPDQSNHGDQNNPSTLSSLTQNCHQESPPPTKAQVVGWPPIRSYRKNCFQGKKKDQLETTAGIYVKVSMDGAPYLRKIDLKVYNNYSDLLKALEDMFKFRVGSEFAPTYEDKDGDWMLLGDVPWTMFINSCKRLRIMKGSEARGLQGCAV
ncbi:auxin-induced protein 22D-like [Carica papaya]|uniref:auxin-induced protein 22D-like n=1 Tax=Carica papaya TaxID=3649 RepID=UPI000B8CEE84|nr:auxin-induced protein 22D-like [Carica papaya]